MSSRLGLKNVAIVTLEQIAPFPFDRVKEAPNWGADASHQILIKINIILIIDYKLKVIINNMLFMLLCLF